MTPVIEPRELSQARRWVVRNADGTEEVFILLLEYDGELEYVPGGGHRTPRPIVVSAK